MEFDESKVYTLVNADKVKLGSKGYFADSLKELKIAVEQERSDNYGEITEIDDDSQSARFRNEYIYYYSLFYLVEESEEKKFRAYVDTDEMIDHFYKHFNLTPQDYSLPTLWVKSKDNYTKYVIVRVTEDEVTICLESYVYTIGLNQLFSRYTWLDDSPCGINEQKMKFDV